MTSHEIARLLDGRAVGDDVLVTDVTTDSRTVTGEEPLFIALRDARDGHDFLADAAEAGAVAALVEREDALPPGLPGVVVEDTWVAIRELAAAVRRRVDPAVIAITGSVGKTTTKDFVAAACSRRRVVAAEGSFNNDLGVPLTLLGIMRDTEILVVEVGARGKGHIASLMPIVRPDVAIVTAVGAGAHLEQFGSVEGVAEAKVELVEGLRAAGTAVLNADDPLVAGMAQRAPGPILTFSAGGNESDLHAEEVTLDGHARPSFLAVGRRSRTPVRLPVAGAHHVGNALAAIAAASRVGVDPEEAAEGLANAKVSRWRSDVRTVRGVRIINDAYNANPTSTLAALDALAAQDVDGRRWAVLGVMAELGDAHDSGHREVGVRAAQVADVVIVVGPQALPLLEGAQEEAIRRAEKGAGQTQVVHAGHVGQAIGLLACRSGDAVLIKASRSAGLERVAVSLVGAEEGVRR